MNEETYSLDFTSATSLPDELVKLLYFEATHNGIEINTLSAEDPMPWDAGVEIDGKDMVISGGFGPSGYGSVVVRLPKKEAKDYYSFSVWIRNDHGQWDQVRLMLEAAGVVVTRKE